MKKKARISGPMLTAAAFVAAFIGFMAILHLGGFYPDRRDFSRGINPVYGVSFRTNYARYLNLDTKETALAIFDDLKTKHIRLIVAWEEIEVADGMFDYSFIDWFIDEAEKRGVKIVLNIGKRVAGWPEFHIPAWARKLAAESINERTMMMIKTLVNRYKTSSAIEMWQIENEPLFYWGELDKIEKEYGIETDIDVNFLKREYWLVKSIDSRPVIITDSGELSDWREASSIGDYFGTTLYRFIWQELFYGIGTRIYYGYMPPATFITPSYYHKKAKKLGLDVNKIFIMELQAEPWIRGKGLLSITPEKQLRVFGPGQLNDAAEFAKKIGFPRAYFWGTEWWYYLKINGQPEVWEEAKKYWQ